MLIQKKLILSGCLSALLPIGFLAFDGQKKDKLYKIIVNYNGQADLLLSLQIFPDYYPYQFKKKELYDYLKNIDSYIVENVNVSENKKNIKKNIQKRINELVGQIKTFGPSLWNKDLYDVGTIYRNDQFWNSKNTHYLFLEQFIVDDYLDMFDASKLLPKHKELIVTNYRAARDPHTIFGKETFEFFKNKKSQSNTTTSTNNKMPKFNEAFYEYIQNYPNSSINSLYRFGKYIEFWNENLSDLNTDNSNDFGKLIEKDDKKLFDLNDAEKDKLFADFYSDALFSEEELKLLQDWYKLDANTSGSSWKTNYLNATTTAAVPAASFSPNNHAPITNLHHPSLEHSPIKGSAPLAEGSQKEVMLYLYQFSKILEKVKNGPEFNDVFKDDSRKAFIENALNNAKEIVKNFQQRIKDIRDYFKAIKVIDNNFDPDSSTSSNENSKSLAIVTYPPNFVGGGNGTLQTISKYPFIYKDLGFKQIIPNTSKDVANATSKNHGHEHHETSSSLLQEIFSVDDNGWWWNIGDTDINKNNLEAFKNQADSIIFLATEEDWNLLSGENSPKLNAFFSLLKEDSKSKAKSYEYEKINTKNYPFSYSKYHLWNEGLRSPIAVNLLLDNLVEIIKNQYSENNAETEKYKKAQDWGKYWEEHFINGTSVNSAK